MLYMVAGNLVLLFQNLAHTFRNDIAHVVFPSKTKSVINVSHGKMIKNFSPYLLSFFPFFCPDLFLSFYLFLFYFFFRYWFNLHKTPFFLLLKKNVKEFFIKAQCFDFH